MTASLTHVVARDGTDIRVRHWPAPVSGPAPWATLLIVHGLAEHSGRYDHVGRFLAAAGIDAHALDLRGFGGSGGRRASVERWSQLHDDLQDRVDALRAAAPARPLVLYGHSLGGLVALGYVLDGRSAPDLLVLSAPALRASIPLWQRVVVRAIGRLAPATMIANRLDPTDLSRDPAVGRSYAADPLNEHQSSLGFGRLALAEQGKVGEAINRLRVPTLVIHGGDDRLVPPAASAVLQGLPDCTRKVYPGLVHELHNEPESEEVLGDIVAWVRERVDGIDYDARN
jgi:alpha-beta hydrolase superfamily lysophospholipase